MSGVITSLLKASANPIFAGISADPLLTGEIHEMRRHTQKMMINFARYSGFQTGAGQDVSHIKAEECIAACQDFDTRLVECLVLRRTSGADEHLRRVATVLEHLHNEMGLPPIQKAAPQPLKLRVLGVTESRLDTEAMPS